MGLYDWIYIKYICPNCKKEDIGEFQTKDLGCSFNRIDIGEDIGDIHLEFIEICKYCRAFIYAFGMIEQGKLKGIKIYRYAIDNEQYIDKSYIWDKELKQFTSSTKTEMENKQ